MDAEIRQRIVILCDFDGTIVDVDTGALILDVFGRGDWKQLDEKLERGEISLEECLAEQFKMVRAPSKKEILKVVSDEKIELRPNFAKFVKYCKEKGFGFVIVTGGIDFCISHLLDSKGLAGESLKIHSAKSKWTRDGLKMIFPKLSNRRSANFKQDLVNHYLNVGCRVIYIGDGVSDYEPARNANLVFAVTGSTLFKMCAKKKIDCVEFTDFASIMEKLNPWVRANETQRGRKGNAKMRVWRKV